MLTSGTKRKCDVCAENMNHEYANCSLGHGVTPRCLTSHSFKPLDLSFFLSVVLEKDT